MIYFLPTNNFWIRKLDAFFSIYLSLFLFLILIRFF